MVSIKKRLQILILVIFSFGKKYIDGSCVFPYSKKALKMCSKLPIELISWLKKIKNKNCNCVGLLMTKKKKITKLKLIKLYLYMSQKNNKK
jgi:hypothetical protein